MNELPTKQDMTALLRQGHVVVDYLRSMKRLYSIVVSKTAEDWVLTQYPRGYTIQNNKLVDADGNLVRDVTDEITEWNYIISAVVAWRMVAAVLENESSFRDQQGGEVLRKHWRTFIDPFLPWDRRGEI